MLQSTVRAEGEVPIILRTTTVWGSRLNHVSRLCLATDVQNHLDSMAPQTSWRLMTSDSFNKPRYEQSSCSRYIRRSSCCIGGGCEFSLYPLVVAAWQETRPPATWAQDAGVTPRSRPDVHFSSRALKRGDVSDNNLLYPHSLYWWLWRLLPMPVV